MEDFLIHQYLGLAMEDVRNLTRDGYLLACAKASLIEQRVRKAKADNVRYGIELALGDVFGKGR